MKQRILLIVAMLLIATPAFATVKIDVTQGTGADVNKLTVSYICTASEKVRAFALNFTLGSAGNSMTFTDINDFNRGESNKPGGGYGIFPGQFRNQIDPANPNWFAQYYNPVAPNDVDSNGTGLGTRIIIAELGTLYKDANAPGASGTLFTVRVDANSKTTDTLYVSANTVRGGIVLESGATATEVNVPFTKTISLASPNVTISGQVVGAVAPRTGGIVGMKMVGLPGEPNTDATGHYSVTVAAGSYTVTPTDPNGQWSFNPASFACGSANLTQNVTGTALECVNAKDPGYANWKTLGKRDCWCFKKQANGDSDGKATLGKNVVLADLTTLKAAYGKTVAQLQALPLEPNDICADFDHKATLSKPVVLADLTILKAWYGKTGVPDGAGTYINAWKN